MSRCKLLHGNFVVADAGSTEQNTSRWVMTCLRIMEEVDAANPHGIELLLRCNSSEKDAIYTMSHVQRLPSATTWAKGAPHSDVAHTWDGGRTRFCCMSCFSSNLVASQATPSDFACFLPLLPSRIDTFDPSGLPTCTLSNSTVHSIKTVSLYLTCHKVLWKVPEWQASRSPTQQLCCIGHND